jgi:hypothetical protein
MILGFYQHINKAPTFFKEKILSCAGIPCDSLIADGSVVKKLYRPKKHTIREDKPDRWRSGLSIQMVYRGDKYKIIDRINDGVDSLCVVKHTQRITIRWRRPKWMLKEYGRIEDFPPFTLSPGNQYLFVYIDDRLIGAKALRDIAINDGFDGITSFLKYFRKSIKNWKLIHWTDLKY